MIAKPCRTTKNLIKDLKHKDNVLTHLLTSSVNKKFPLLKNTRNNFNKIADYLSSNYGNVSVPEKVLDDIIAKGIPKKNGNRDILFKDKGNIKKYQMMYKIHAMLHNPVLLDNYIKHN